jgi:predicted Zn-dependent protease
MRPPPSEARRWPRIAASWLTALLLAALLPGCATLTVAEERQLGEEIARKVGGELLFIRDAVVIDYVGAIGGEIVRAAGPQPFEYRFAVVENDEINAFTGPAGHIYIHTGVILKARNASELAAVLAHEVGHAVLRHVAKSYERSRGAGTLQQAGVLAASVFGYGGLANLGGGLAAMTVLNSFTRGEEREADAFAIEVLPAAGYDPNGLLTFLEVVREAEQGPVAPAFLSSHPGTQERIAEAEALIAARPPRPGLRVTDHGRLEIIQRRIRLLTHKAQPMGRQPL